MNTTLVKNLKFPADAGKQSAYDISDLAAASCDASKGANGQQQERVNIAENFVEEDML